MSDVIAFLKERLDGEESAARRATPGPWIWTGDYPDGVCPHSTEWCDHGPDLETSDAASIAVHGQYVVTSGGYDASNLSVSDDNAAHIAYWSPTRILAEIAAKREVLAQHGVVPEGSGYDPDGKGGRYTYGHMSNVCSTCGTPDEYAERSPCGTLLALVAPYSTHPDYDPEWTRG